MDRWCGCARSAAALRSARWVSTSVRRAPPPLIAGRPSTVYRLSADALKTCASHDPEVAALLHEWIARMLAERLAANNRTIEALLE